jgi:hypothetical protein
MPRRVDIVGSPCGVGAIPRVYPLDCRAVCAQMGAILSALIGCGWIIGYTVPKAVGAAEALGDRDPRSTSLPVVCASEPIAGRWWLLVSIGGSAYLTDLGLGEHGDTIKVVDVNSITLIHPKDRAKGASCPEIGLCMRLRKSIYREALWDTCLSFSRCS